MNESIEDKYLFEQLKTTMALTSGTLIVSLSVINTKIQLMYKGALYISWLFLINSIVFGILAMTAAKCIYSRSQNGKQGALTGREKEMYDKGEVLTPFEAKTPCIHLLSFILGLVSFFIFVFLNVNAIMKW